MQKVLTCSLRKIALALALLVGALCLCAGVTALVCYQQNSTRRELESASKTILALRGEFVSALRLLNARMAASCDESTLRSLRAFRVHTHYIADIAILDEQGSVQCSTTIGRLTMSVQLGPADFEQITADGSLIRDYVARRLPGLDSPRNTIHIALGRFLISPSADILDSLLEGNVLVAVRLMKPGGFAVTVVEKPLIQPWIADGWNGLAYVQSIRTPDIPYLVQSVSPIVIFLKAYSGPICAILLLTVLVTRQAFVIIEPWLLRTRALESRITSLLKPENLICVYQPIIDMSTGKPTGCEVLMRLRDGEEIISPNIVLPAVVSRNLMWQLDQLVVKVAVDELARISPVLENFKVAFNFFPASITSGKVGAMIEAALAGTSLGCLKFNVEVLEHDYGDSIVESIADLQRRGFLVSVDDFGTGFSNLNTIKLLSPDLLKIDQSFVHDMTDSRIRSSLIPEIVGIARAMGARLVAEGIENEHQYAMLKRMGVEYGQGYYMSKPLTIEALCVYLLRTCYVESCSIPAKAAAEHLEPEWLQSLVPREFAERPMGCSLLVDC